MADALGSSDRTAVGRIMLASHESLRDDFESSTPELDTMVMVATEIDGCHGARVTGAGFGGAAVAAVASGAVEAFLPEIMARYQAATDIEPAVHVCIPSDGAAIT